MAKPQGPSAHIGGHWDFQAFLDISLDTEPSLLPTEQNHGVKAMTTGLEHSGTSCGLLSWQPVIMKLTCPCKRCAHSEPWKTLNGFCKSREFIPPGRKEEHYPEVSVHNVVCQAVSCCSHQGREIFQERISFEKAQFCNILSTGEKGSVGSGIWARSNLTKIVSKPGTATVIDWCPIYLPSEPSTEPRTQARQVLV